MGCLNVLRMVISPRPAHPFGINVVRDDVVIFSELNVADGAFSVLLDYFRIQQSPHFRR
jgi:hypothetical protein